MNNHELIPAGSEIFGALSQRRVLRG